MSNELELKQATQDILHAGKSLRDLAERVKAYPDAAQRLGEVCGVLERTATSLQTAAGTLKNHEILMEQANQRLGRLENMIETLSATLKQQSSLLEKAASKRGIVF